jgi:hypothetical protein
MLEEGVEITEAALPRVVGFGYRLLLNALLLSSLVLSVLFMFFFAAVFFTLLGWLMKSMHQNPPGWGLALGLALLASWSWMYLMHDWIGLVQNRRLKQQLKIKAERAFGKPLPESAHFIELRPLRPNKQLRWELGWLVLTEEALLLFGDRKQLKIARAAFDPKQLHTEGNSFGLLPTWIQLGVSGRWQGLSLLCRDSARRLSETTLDARRLHSDLEQWLEIKQTQ